MRGANEMPDEENLDLQTLHKKIEDGVVKIIYCIEIDVVAKETAYNPYNRWFSDALG